MSDVTVGLAQRRRSRVEAEQLVREYELSGLSTTATSRGSALRLGDHLKAAIDYHFKTGHREAA
jgi:hypothetical protein